MKKTNIIILALVMVLAAFLTACTSNANTPALETLPGAQTEAPPTSTPPALEPVPSPDESEPEDNTYEPTTPDSIDMSGYNDDDYSKYIDKSGISSGILDNASDEVVTRAQFVTMLSRHFTHGQTMNIEKYGDYTDVADDEYYAGAAYWAQNNEFDFGATENEFFPNEPISREDAAAMLYSYGTGFVELVGLSVSDEDIVPFSDSSSISDYAKEGAEYLRAIKIIDADKSGNFNPKEALTKSEWAAWYSRYCLVLWDELPTFETDFSQGCMTVHG